MFLRPFRWPLDRCVQTKLCLQFSIQRSKTWAPEYWWSDRQPLLSNWWADSI